MELGYVDIINLILVLSYIIKNPYNDVCYCSSFFPMTSIFLIIIETISMAILH